MWCGQCDHGIAECTCENLTERMRSASDSPHVALKWCRACDEYHHRCQCDDPDWVIRTDGAFVDNPVLLRRFGIE